MIYLVAIISIAACSNLLAEQSSNTFRIVVTGIENPQGKINVGLYNSTSDFPHKESVFQGQTVRADSTEVVVTFSGLPQGDYAVAIFHDENDNGKLDKNFIGIPSEAYGFSNDAHGRFGPPTFEEAKVSLSPDRSLEITVTIK